MKKLLLLPFFVATFLSCVNKEAQDRRRFVQDSIRAVQENVDRLNQLRIDSLSLIAWGDAKFGMSTLEASQTQIFKGSKASTGYYEWTQHVSANYDSRNISNTRIGLYSLDAWFESNELRSINIKSNEKDASYLDQMERDIDVIKNGLTSKYGSPIYDTKQFNIFSFTKRDEIIFTRWEIGDKKIDLVLGEYSSTYYYKINIRNSKYPTIDDPRKLEYQENQKALKEDKNKLEF